jgi:hypothetical protein
MGEVGIRMPHDHDWPAILQLANQSLIEVPGAPGQQEWLDNRRSYSRSQRIQQHFVASSGDQIVGYACIEHRDNFKLHPPAIKAAHGEYRLFGSSGSFGPLDTRHSIAQAAWPGLIDLGARRVWMTEYEADARFVSYLEGMGFVRQASFRLPDWTTVVRMIMDAPFKPLTAVEEPR